MNTAVVLVVACWSFTWLCAPVTPQRMFGWRGWSRWTPCVVTCGRGVHLRSRACRARRLADVVIYCQGRRLQTMSCIRDPCPASTSNGESNTTAENSSSMPTNQSSTNFPTERVCPWLCNTSATVCGRRPPNQVKKILGGEHARANSWPWQVAIWSRNKLECGATVICKRWVLTAAHCFFNLTTLQYNFLRRDNPYHMEMRFGYHSRNGSNENVTIIPLTGYHVAIHPWYEILRKTYDVALIRLDNSLEFNHFVAPACLPNYDSLPVGPRTRCRVIGWGETKGIGPSNNELKELSVEVVPNNVCRYAYNYPDTQMILCAGGQLNEDACQGDSGGPLLCQSPTTQRWEIQGIVSFGSSRCGRVGSPTLFMQVSFFLPWIQDVMQRECQTWERNMLNP